MKKLRISGLFLILFSLNACGLSGGPIAGQVLDADTRKPLADVYMDFRWQGYIFFGGASTCAHIETTITNQQGKYKTPRWTEKSKNGERMDSKVPFFDVYKHGYSLSRLNGSQMSEQGDASENSGEDKNKAIIFMQPYEGTDQERLQYLIKLSRHVQCFGKNEKNAFPMHRAIYQEAKALAVSDQDRLDVRGVRASAAAIWLGGNTEALDLHSIEALIHKDKYLSEQLNDGFSQPEKEQPGVNVTVLPSPEPRPIQKAP